MNETTIREALDAAILFRERAKAVLADKEALLYVAIGAGEAKTGALRRQSMELTRALARMRRAG